MADDLHPRVDLAHYADRLLAAHREVTAEVADVVAWLASCEIRQLGEGKIICREGDVGSELYVLLEGRVFVEKSDLSGESRRVGEVTAPTLLGQMAMIDRARRTATCAAATEVWVATMGRDRFRRLIRSTDPAGTALRRLLLSSLTQQLLSGNTRLGELLTESEGRAELESKSEGISGALLKASGLLEGWMSSGNRR